MISLAVLYIAQDALFLGIVQVVVYTGAVMMLFLFVLMLIGVDSSDSLVETIRGQRIAAVVVGVGFGVLLIAGIGNLSVTGFAGLPDANSSGNVEGLAALIFTRYLWAFELTSALLITAALGAMVWPTGSGSTGASLSGKWPKNASKQAATRPRDRTPVCSPDTMRSTSRRCFPTAPVPRCQSAQCCSDEASSACRRQRER